MVERTLNSISSMMLLCGNTTYLSFQHFDQHSKRIAIVEASAEVRHLSKPNIFHQMCCSVTCNDSIYHERLDPENSSASMDRMGIS